jgi:hypothetical protein
MTAKARLRILRANALFLLAASTGGLIMDILGSFFARGPEAAIVAAAPGSGIGFIEAHGLAFILGTLLWRAASVRRWHLTAAGIHLLLGTANLVFWPFFIATDSLAMGYVTTGFHWLFVVVQTAAAVSARAEARAEPLAA